MDWPQAFHDVALVFGGSLLGGISSRLLAKQQAKDQARIDLILRRRESLKEIGVKLGEVCLVLKDHRRRALDRAHEFVEAKKAGQKVEWMEPDAARFRATVELLFSLIPLSKINDHEDIAAELVKILDFQNKGMQETLRALRSASSEGTISPEVEVALQQIDKDQNASIERVYTIIKINFNS